MRRKCATERALANQMDSGIRLTRNDDYVQSKWASCVPSIMYVAPWSFEKQRRLKIVDTSLWWLRNCRATFPKLVSVNQPRIHWAASDWCEEHSLSALNTASRELINDGTYKCIYLDELISHRRRSIKKSENSWSYKQIEQPQGEQEAFSKLSEAEFRTRILRRERKNHILAQKRYEWVWQERRADKAESSKQHLGKQFLKYPTGNGRIEESADTGNGRIFSRQITIKSERCNLIYCPNSGIARRSKLHHCFSRISRCRISLQFKIFRTFQCSQILFSSLVGMLSRDQSKIRHTKLTWYVRGRFLEAKLHGRIRRHLRRCASCVDDILPPQSSDPCSEPRWSLSRQEREGGLMKDNLPTPRFSGKVVNLESSILCRRSLSSKLYGWLPKTPDLRAALRQVPYVFHNLVFGK